MAGPRWEPVYREREWPLTCPWCYGSDLPEPARLPCDDCNRLIEWSWCPHCEREWGDPNHYCTDAQFQQTFHQERERPGP